MTNSNDNQSNVWRVLWESSQNRMGESKDGLSSRLEHFVKNRLQGALGGSFLVDSGIRRSEMSTISQGWQIVSQNQAELIRCFSHLVNLSRDIPAQLETCDLTLLFQAALEDFELLRTKLGIPGKVKMTFEFANPIPCRIEPLSIRSSITGLLRIGAAYCQLENSAVAVASKELPGDRKFQIRFECREVETIFRTRELSDSADGVPMNEAHLMEWEMAAYVTQCHNGLLTLVQNGSNQFIIQLELPFPV
jgi:hypothetical protein